MTEDYVSLEVAKLLKEKGFNEICRAAYTVGGKFITHHNYYSQCKDECIAPTHQMAMAWLRENHNIHIVIEAYPHEDGCFYWCYRIMETVKIETLFGYFKKAQKSGFDSYEDAVEAALKYSLENLI